MADTDAAAEPIFRANKRRKVFRKRAVSEGEEDGGTMPDNAAEVMKDGAEDGAESALRIQRKVGAKKHGIAFSSTPGGRPAQQDETEGHALVPFQQDVAQEMQNDRFVKPTGREVVTEDKHMMAYIDSKLAEMRNADASPAPTEQTNGPMSPTSTALANVEGRSTMPGRSDERTLQAAQARSDRVYQRPTKRPRKKRHERDEADIARDAYIDQFMQEAQVPIYDRSNTSKNVEEGEDADNDAATAEAFKAQLLADMAMQRRRPPKTAAEKAATAASGPKLGGSRQQREKMRAMQEAEGKK